MGFDWLFKPAACDTKETFLRMSRNFEGLVLIEKTSNQYYSLISSEFLENLKEISVNGS